MPIRQGLIIKKITNVSSRTSATSLSFTSFSFKTVFRRSQRPFWSFSVTLVASLALPNSFFPPLRCGMQRCTHNSPVTVSHVARMSTDYEQVAGVRASIPRSRDMHLINVWSSKISLAPPLWFRAINTFRNETVKMQTYVSGLLNAF